MKKYVFMLLCGMLWMNSGYARENVLCQNDDSLTEFCKGAVDAMYKGFVDGYTDSMKKYQEKENPNSRLVFEGVRELIPYDVFQSAFKFCGETQKNMQYAQKCLLKELQKYILSQSRG